MIFSPTFQTPFFFNCNSIYFKVTLNLKIIFKNYKSFTKIGDLFDKKREEKKREIKKIS